MEIAFLYRFASLDICAARFLCSVLVWKAETGSLEVMCDRGIGRQLTETWHQCTEFLAVFYTALNCMLLMKVIHWPYHVMSLTKSYMVRSASRLWCLFFYISRLSGYSVERQLTTDNKILIEILMKLCMRSQRSQLGIYSTGCIWLHSPSSCPQVHPTTLSTHCVLDSYKNVQISWTKKTLPSLSLCPSGRKWIISKQMK